MFLLRKSDLEVIGKRLAFLGIYHKSRSSLSNVTDRQVFELYLSVNQLIVCFLFCGRSNRAGNAKDNVETKSKDLFSV